MKHTPGPWEATRGRSYLDEEMCWMVPGVAHCGDGGNSEANARLIAAAPDLHVALQEAFDWLPLGLDRGDPEMTREYVEFLALARAALAKAKPSP